jgi:hypothetical protein
MERGYTQFRTTVETLSPAGNEDFALPAGSSYPCVPTKKARAPPQQEIEAGQGPSIVSSVATAALPSTSALLPLFLTRSLEPPKTLFSDKAVSPESIDALITARKIREISSASASIFPVKNNARCLNPLFTKLHAQ